LLLDNKEQVKQPSASVIPDIQLSFKDGMTQLFIGIIVYKFFFNNLSLKDERKVKNLAFLVGNTIFPLNIKQINIRFLIS
jgi:hypothetical protein